MNDNVLYHSLPAFASLRQVLGQLHDVPVFRLGNVSSSVNTCRLLVTYRISVSHVRANERNAALLAAYTPKPGKPFTDATDPVMMIDPPSLSSGSAF
jgi:hypothetical protein